MASAASMMALRTVPPSVSAGTGRGRRHCDDGARLEPAVVFHFDVAEGAVGVQNVIASVEVKRSAGNA